MRPEGEYNKACSSMYSSHDREKYKQNTLDRLWKAKIQFDWRIQDRVHLSVFFLKKKAFKRSEKNGDLIIVRADEYLIPQICSKRMIRIQME